jgi:hypothetical protein
MSFSGDEDINLSSVAEEETVLSFRKSLFFQQLVQVERRIKDKVLGIML